jgi:TonB family protein
MRRPLQADPNDFADLPRVYEACPDYFERCLGGPAGPAEAQSSFAHLPPGRSFDDKFVFGILDGSRVTGFIVATDGHVRDPRVLKATHREFGVAALKAASQWKFRPGFKAGRRVNTRMEVPVIFDLQDAASVPPACPDGKHAPPPSDSA